MWRRDHTGHGVQGLFSVGGGPAHRTPEGRADEEIELLETTDPTVYFDAQDDLIASPIQCFLELQAGDKRDQDTAEQVRRLILRNTNDQRKDA